MENLALVSIKFGIALGSREIGHLVMRHLRAWTLQNGANGATRL